LAVPIEALVEMAPEFTDDSAASIGVTSLAAFAAIVKTGDVKSGETVLVDEGTSKKKVVIRFD
jgi:NADPH:quinone reductase-like Zn-dependent oxidoreductase